MIQYLGIDTGINHKQVSVLVSYLELVRIGKIFWNYSGIGIGIWVSVEHKVKRCLEKML